MRTLIPPRRWSARVCGTRRGLSVIQLIVTLGVVAALSGGVYAATQVHATRSEQVELARTLLRYAVDTSRAAAADGSFDTSRARAAASPTGLQLEEMPVSAPGTAMVATGASGQTLTATSMTSHGRCITVTVVLGARRGLASQSAPSADGCVAVAPETVAGLPQPPAPPDPVEVSSGTAVAGVVDQPGAELVAATADAAVMAAAEAPEHVEELPPGRHLYLADVAAAQQGTQPRTVRLLRDGFNRPIAAPDGLVAGPGVAAFVTGRQLTSAPVPEGARQVVQVAADGSFAVLRDGDLPFTADAGSLRVGAAVPSAAVVEVARSTLDRQAGWWRLTTSAGRLAERLPFDVGAPVALSPDGSTAAGFISGRLHVVSDGTSPEPLAELDTDRAAIAAVGADGTVALVRLGSHGPQLRIVTAAAVSPPLAGTGQAAIVEVDGTTTVALLTADGVTLTPAETLVGGGEPQLRPLPTPAAPQLTILGTTASTLLLAGEARQLAGGCSSARPLLLEVAFGGDGTDRGRLRLPPETC